MVQLRKAVKEYALETEDPLISSLKGFKQALLTKFKTRAFASKTETEKPLTKVQHQQIKTCLEKIKLREVFNKNDDVLIFFDFLQLTAVIV